MPGSPATPFYTLFAKWQAAHGNRIYNNDTTRVRATWYHLSNYIRRQVVVVCVYKRKCVGTRGNNHNRNNSNNLGAACLSDCHTLYICIYIAYKKWAPETIKIVDAWMRRALERYSRNYLHISDCCRIWDNVREFHRITSTRNSCEELVGK